MILRHKSEFEFLFLLLFASAVGFTLAFYTTQKSLKSNILQLPIVKGIQNTNLLQGGKIFTLFTTTIPTPTPLLPQPIITSQISPDGTKQLIMTVTTNKDTSKMYKFTTANADGTNQQLIYSVIYSSQDTMSIPFDTWSPDDKYIFVTHTSQSGTEALVFQANGQPLDQTIPFLNLSTFFTTKNTGNSYSETTGWASETLLIINAKTHNNSIFSYWIELPDKAIIPLSSQFL